MLTRKQKELLVILWNAQQAGEIMPSYDEMRDLVGLKSKSGIHRLIAGLEERKYIQRLPHRARAIEVIKGPDCKKVDAEGLFMSIASEIETEIGRELTDDESELVADAVLKTEEAINGLA